MADFPYRINLLIGTQTGLAAGQEEGMPGIISNNAYRFGWYAGGAWRIAALRGSSESFQDVTLTGLTANTIPLLDADKKTTNSSLTEDATSVKSAKPMTLNGATRPVWYYWTIPLQISNESAITAINGSKGDQIGFARNFYVGQDGNKYPVSTRTAGGYPTQLVMDDLGRMRFYSSLTAPTIGTPITDFALRFDVSKEGLLSQFGSEIVTSGRYVKTTDTTIGPSATAKASLLNGATSGFTAVTDPANRWNAVGAASETELKGNVSSAANQVLTFEFYRNGVVSATLTLPARSYGTLTPWRLVIDQVVRVAGSSGTVRVKIRAYITADNINAAASCYDMSATLTGIDLTASHTWDVVCTIPNNASNSIFCDFARKAG